MILPKPKCIGIAAIVALVVTPAVWLGIPYVRGVFVRLDYDRAWIVELGRGSGMHGLDTIKVFEDGTAIVHRRTRYGWRIASLQLDADDLTRVREAITKHRLALLDKEYHANIMDGTQWVLRINESDHVKRSYFNNSFPNEVLLFAAELDNLLANGGDGVVWRGVAYSNRRWPEQELWESIR